MQQRNDRPPRLRRAAWALATASVAASVALWLLPPTVTAAAPARSFIEEVGTLERFPADARAALGEELVPHWSEVESDFLRFDQKNIAGTAVMLPEVRQLWQIYPHHQSQARTGIVVRDLDTMKIVTTILFDGTFTRATAHSTKGSDWAHALDPVGRRLFVVGCACGSSSPERLYEFDLDTFGMTTRQLLMDAAPITSDIRLAGVTYDAYADDVVLLYGGPQNTNVLNFNAFLYRLDVSGPPVVFDPAKLYRLRACTGPFGSLEPAGDTYDWEVLVTRDHLYVPCMRAGHTVIVVRTARPEGSGSPTHPEDVAAGAVYGRAVFADQAAGRLFAMSVQGQEIWAFEAATMAFVGVVAAGPAGTSDPTGFGLDRRTGRMFFQSPTFGLGVVEGRFFPIPQARTHPRRAQGQERILSDAPTGRLFVLEGNGLELTRPSAYRVYRVETAPVPPAAPDPDRNTADVDEREGVTEARWNASGSGYGSRVLLAKGYATVVPAPTVGSVAPTANIGNQLQRFCGYTDRDLFAGRVARAEYDTGSTAAAAVAADVDNATRQDLNQPSRCNDPSAPKTTFLDDAKRWAYTPASCTSSQSEEPRSTPAGDEGAAGTLGEASATCPAPGGVLQASARTRTTGLDAVGVAVQRSETTVDVRRLADGGVRSTVESVARGVSLEVPGVGTVAFGEVRSKATSFSDGRPHREPLSDHEVEISQVRVGDDVHCATACDEAELEEALNAAAGSRAVFRTGRGRNSGRDEDLVAGSPKGAQTAVQKSVARQASDRALVGDYTVEVPALEVTVFNDNPGWGRARQIYQFAGVAASATYNVVVRPAGLGSGPDVGGDGLPQEPASPASVLSNPYDGLMDATAPYGDVLGPVVPTAAPGGGGESTGVADVLRAVARGLRLFLTSPRTAVLLLTAWALLGSPAVLSRRRRLLAGVRAG